VEKLTITEALSEINLLKKKINDKQEQVLKHVVRASHVLDPFEKDGGSKRFIEKEMQSLGDLRKRLVRIRSKIQEENTKTMIVVNGKNQAISEWLSWKKDIAESEVRFLTVAHTNVKNNLDSAEKNPSFYKDKDGNNCFVQVVPNIDYQEVLKEREALAETADRLDGMLSLKNATTTIEV
jgi:hypothetical protein